MHAENQRLRRRNGQLLVEMEEMKVQVDKSKAEMLQQSLQQKPAGFNPLQRPQTSSGAFMRRKEDMLLTQEEVYSQLNDTTQDDFDKELNDLIAKNQKSLSELHTDMKEVSKIAGEAVVNVRSIKQSGNSIKQR